MPRATLRSRARSALVVLVALVAIVATAASGDVDGGGGGGGSGDAGIISYDPDGTGAGDVTRLELVEEAGATAAAVTITNRRDVKMSYTVSVAADAPDGSVRYGDTAVYVYQLGPGQTATAQEIFVGAIPADAVPVIKDVESVASP